MKVSKTDSNLTITFQVDQSPKEVFDAITNVRGWWSEGLKGKSRALNDEFTYRHRNIHFSKQRLIEVVPDKKVMWLVTESNLSFVKKTSEWTNTNIVFEISAKGGKTQLTFTHMGLTPGVECYDDCSEGWSYYINSLKQLIVTGEGTPDSVEVATALS